MSTGLLTAIISLLVVLVMLSAFFSAAETAYSSVSQSRILSSLKNGKRSAILIDKHHNSFGWVLSTILIANNLVNILATTVVTFLLSSFVSSGNATIISTGVMTPVIVLLGEIIPKLLAKKYSYGYLVKIVFVMEALNWIFLPFTFWIKKFTLKAKITNTENDLKTYISIASDEGVLEKREATLANNSLDLDSKTLRSIYVPLKNVVSVKSNISVEAAKAVFKKTGHSRLPVSKNGTFIGTILLKDVIFSGFDLITPMIKDVPSIYATAIATSALEMMRINSTHMIFIRGSNKKIIGILTLEDIIEELIGEIYDEHDTETLIKQISLHKYHVVQDALITDLQNELGIVFEFTTPNQTVKQWLSARITRNFKKNIIYTYKDQVKFKVIENTKKHGAKIEVTQK